MSTISKISIGGKDYDIGQSGLGTLLKSSDDINSLTTASTRFYFDGKSTYPTNSPFDYPFTLRVEASPSGEGVIQTAEGSGIRRTRTKNSDGSWSTWAYPVSDNGDSGWSYGKNIKGDGEQQALYYRRVCEIVFLKVSDPSVTVSPTAPHYHEFGTIDYKPSFGISIPIQYTYQGSRYTCSLIIDTDGSVEVSGVMEPGTNESVSINAFVCFPNAI